jgi:hypothetical protein
MRCPWRFFRVMAYEKTKHVPFSSWSSCTSLLHSVCITLSSTYMQNSPRYECVRREHSTRNVQRARSTSFAFTGQPAARPHPPKPTRTQHPCHGYNDIGRAKCHMQVCHLVLLYVRIICNVAMGRRCLLANGLVPSCLTLLRLHVR